MASDQPSEPAYYLTPADLVRCHAAALEIAESTARHHMLHRDVNDLRWLQSLDVDDVVAQMTGLTTRRIKGAEFAMWWRQRLHSAERR